MAEVDNCFSVFTQSDLNRIEREPLKKRLVSLTGEFMREHVAVNRTVMSNTVALLQTVKSSCTDRSMDNTDRYSAGVLDKPQTEMRNKS